MHSVGTNTTYRSLTVVHCIAYCEHYLLLQLYIITNYLYCVNTQKAPISQAPLC